MVCGWLYGCGGYDSLAKLWEYVVGHYGSVWLMVGVTLSLFFWL